MGDKSGKSDMERIGLFQEMAYISIGDTYIPRSKFAFNRSASGGKQMLPGGSKEMSGLQHGYFDVKYNRIFEGEGFSDPVSIRRRFRMEQRKRDIGKPFLPANGIKMGCGLGSYYGTIGGSVSAFSPVFRQMKGQPSPGRNIFTSPGKNGTGYGYASVTLSPYPSHAVDPFMKAKEEMQLQVLQHKKSLKGGPFRLNMHPEEFFGPSPFRMDKDLPPTKKKKLSAPSLDQRPFKPTSPGKRSGGGKFGTFDPYPQHAADAYTDKIKKARNVVNSSGKLYMPASGPKSRPANSLIEQNILRTMNIKNFRTMTVS